MFRSSNPTLRETMFDQERSHSQGDTMTIQGTVNKSFLLLGLVVLSAYWIWGQVAQPVPLVEYGAVRSANPVALSYSTMAAIAGFVIAMVTIFKREWAGITAPFYALCQGVFLGGISAVFDMQYPGIVVQAVSLTFGVMFCMLAIYKSGIIQVNEKFIFGIASATGAIALVYLMSIILGFFGRGVPALFGSGPVGIGFSLIVVGIAAFNLVVDFYMIEQYSKLGLKKHMEWYGAFSLLVTLVWLYLEMLRLLAKLNSRR